MGITPSNSRQRVSNDNTFAESIFKTLKYRPNYLPQGFASAREWVLEFVIWYNFEHHHSGLKYLTPNQRHCGEGEVILTRRKTLYEEAKAKFPVRWRGRNTRNREIVDVVFLNPVSIVERKIIA